MSIPIISARRTSLLARIGLFWFNASAGVQFSTHFFFCSSGAVRSRVFSKLVETTKFRSMPPVRNDAILVDSSGMIGNTSSSMNGMSS